MTHYRMLDRAPSVVITSNRNELKLYQDNTVYLNDGDNFELRFFNPLKEKVGVEIMFNGIRKGDGYLVINPGQDLILDRFLDEQRKMLFETYIVDGNNADAVEAIQQNGLITFNFYKEKNSYNYYSNNESDVNIKYNFPPKPTKYNYKSFNANNICGSSVYSSGTGGNSANYVLSGATGPAGIPGLRGVQGSNTTTSITATNTTLGRGTTIFTSSVTFDGNISNTNTGNYNEYIAENLEKSIDYTDYLADSLETGRIEKGEISNQKLKGVNLQFSSSPFHTTTYKILPYSAMNRTIGEVRQYCEFCSYRLRKNTWKYCPKCGNKLD